MKWLFVVAVLSTSLGAISTQPNLVQGYGAGYRSCGEWTQQHAAAGDFWLAGVQNEWVLGFVSGVATTGAFKIKETDAAGIEAFVNKYCDAHPVEGIYEATAALIRELRVSKQ